ncbi:MAG: hypothetical protein WBX01_14850 [Nitrososphaeraceae archaeon]|jgi:phosphoglycerol transferase MdoB-like AlkP superfamily enzyme
MTLELFGIETGDFKAVVGLIVTALLFYFGRRHKRKSEQFNVANNFLDKIFEE